MSSNSVIDDQGLTVVIINWNTKNMLKNCLYSLKEENEYTKLSVIVVDNASTDGSLNMVKELFPEIYLINSGRNAGFAAANNIALKHCKTPYILFLNPDTLVMPDSIRKMIEIMLKDSSIGAVGCKMKDEFGKVQPLGLQWFPTPFTELISLLIVSTQTMRYMRKILPYKDPEVSGYVKKIFGGCFLARKEVLDKIGYFDDRYFMYVEDVDLCKRIIESGWKIYYLSESEIIHYCGASSNKAGSNFSVLMKCESIGKYMGKYYGKFGVVKYKIIVFIGSNIRLLILSLIKMLSYIFRKKLSLDYKNIVNKHWKMILWSMNMEKAVIKT